MATDITPDPSQAVTGTVTANAGTNLNTSALALDATVGTTNTEVGATNETAASSDTATAGLNGRLQRLAQRLTSLIAVFNIGAGTEAAAVRVTLPTDGTGKVNAAQSGTWNVGTVTTVTAVTAITNALPAGSNAIGKLAANSGVDIGDVDVTSLPALVAGTANIGDVDVLTMPGTGVEDAAETAGGTLVMSGTVRRDTAASSAGTTGDNATLNTDANGKVWVNVGGNQIAISQTPTVTNGAYAAEDVIGGLLTFANAAAFSGGSGFVQGITIMCKSPLTVATVPSLELAFFNQTFTAMSDNGTWSPSDADMANCIGTIPISAWNVTTTNVIATRFGLGFPFVLTGTSLFAQLITHTAVTLTSTSDIIVGITCLRD